MSGSRTQKSTGMDRPLRIKGHPILGPAATGAVVALTVDGREIEAYEGEPIAVAMIAARIPSARTMPDSGSPRGYFCGVGRCTDCLMTVDGTLNVRTCVTSVADGMVVVTQQGLGEWTVRS